MTPDRRTIFSLFAIAFGLRVLYAVVFASDPSVITDPVSWDYRIARDIHDNLTWLSTPFTPRAPGYILVLAAMFRVIGVGYWRAILLNAFIGAATVLFVYRIGENHLGRGIGLVAALWLATYVHHVHFSAILVRDVLTTFLVMWFMHLIVRPFENMRTAVFSGVIFAVLMHVEPAFLLAAPLVVLLLALWSTRHRILSIQFSTLFLVTVVGVSTPWTIRNAAVYHEPVPIALEVTRSLRPIARIVGWANEAQSARDQLRRLRQAGPPALKRRIHGALYNAVEFWRVTRFWRSPREPAWSLRHNLISSLQFGLLLPGLLLSLWAQLRSRNRAAIALLILVATWFVVRVYMGGSERARLPVEPAIGLLSFYGYAWTLTALRAGRARSSPPGLEFPGS